ncbi:hypothetical protein As57867_005278, partial [Aphanomyces stellatus]
MSLCDRYEIVGDPVYVSSTSVVVKAIDRRIARVTFDEYANRDDVLTEQGFVNCMQVLASMATKDVRDSPVWCEQQFDAFHKDKGGNISWTVFESFCNEVCGEFHVAIKFMRSRQSSDRELNIRDGVESKYVVPTLPCDQNAIERNVASLT